MNPLRRQFAAMLRGLGRRAEAAPVRAPAARPEMPGMPPRRTGNAEPISAVRPREAPDAGSSTGAQNAYVDQLRGEGFDVDTPLFHGTDEVFEQFDQGRAGAASHNRYPGDPVFLTDNAGSASDYAMQRDPAWDPVARPNVRPVYARLRNPLVIDAEGKGYGAVSLDAITEARANGHDGVIIRNVLDSAGPRARGVPQTVYAIFDPSNIRSRFGNATRAPDGGARTGNAEPVSSLRRRRGNMEP